MWHTCQRQRSLAGAQEASVWEEKGCEGWSGSQAGDHGAGIAFACVGVKELFFIRFYFLNWMGLSTGAIYIFYLYRVFIFINL